MQDEAAGISAYGQRSRAAGMGGDNGNGRSISAAAAAAPVGSMRVPGAQDSCRFREYEWRLTNALTGAPPDHVATCVQRLSCDTSAASAKRRKLAVVMSFSPDYMARMDTDANQQAILRNWKAYCARHGYKLFVVSVEGSPRLPFMYARWVHLLKNADIWEGYEWVLPIDGDTVAINGTLPLARFMAGDHHLTFAVREQREVIAGAMLLRTTPFARCFVEQWMERRHEVKANTDNGDLLEHLLEYHDQNLARQCAPKRPKDENWSEYLLFERCFGRVHRRLQRWQAISPFRFEFPLSGFWRSISGISESIRSQVGGGC